MQIPLKISFKNMDPSPAIEERIRERAATLERFADRIASCRVVVGGRSHHQRQGGLYEISVDITVPPKGEIFIGREHRRDHAHEDVFVAIRDAFDAAARQLEDHVRRARADVKGHAVPLHGRVARLFEDHGFIETSDGQEVYFHRNSVVEGGFDALKQGAEVRLVMTDRESDKGPQATTVHPVGKHHPVG